MENKYLIKLRELIFPSHFIALFYWPIFISFIIFGLIIGTLIYIHGFSQVSESMSFKNIITINTIWRYLEFNNISFLNTINLFFLICLISVNIIIFFISKGFLNNQSHLLQSTKPSGLRQSLKTFGAILISLATAITLKDQMISNDNKVWEDKTDLLKQNATDKAKLLELNDTNTILKTDITKRDIITNELEQKWDDVKISEFEETSKSFILGDLWAKFDTLDGIGKLSFVMVFSGYNILSCLLAICTFYYGDYLIDRFNLKTKYPKLSKWIDQRKKLGRYAVVFNILLIVSSCLVQMTLGLYALGLIAYYK